MAIGATKQVWIGAPAQQAAQYGLVLKFKCLRCGNVYDNLGLVLTHTLTSHPLLEAQWRLEYVSVTL